MTLNNTIPYKDRNFIVDDSDHQLFIMMKSIVDSNFPPSGEPMLLELYKILWEKRRRLAYKEMKNGSIYISFPRINPFIRLIGSILMRFTSKDEDEDGDDEDGSLRQVV